MESARFSFTPRMWKVVPFANIGLIKALIALSLFRYSSGSVAPCSYEPTWDSLDQRPLPDWFDDAKFGIFLHWGVYSVPSFGSEWFWFHWAGSKPGDKYQVFMEKNYPPSFTYADFAKDFKAEFYDPKEWTDIIKSSGAKYVVVTSKHHEGFTMYPSKYSFSWNAMDVGPKRDLLGELAAAVRNGSDMHFGIYHSLFDWFHPLYKKDKESGFKTQDFVKSKALPELYELVMEYHPEVVWSDGDWEAPDQYWNSTGFLAWLYNESPVKDIVVTNDRWGQGCPCKHGGYYSCADRFNPGTLQKHKWESCTTIDRESWGYRREARFADFYSIEEILKMLVGVVSCGGNLLLNVGPTSYGKISPIFEERLHQMGEWLKVNGEAIYKTRPWPKAQNDTLSSFVWYTQGKSSPAVYAIALEWPDNEVLHLGAPKPTETTEVYMLGYDKPLRWKSVKDGMVVDFPNMSRVSSKWSWVLKLLDVA